MLVILAAASLADDGFQFWQRYFGGRKKLEMA
jgi:hypothetical protein